METGRTQASGQHELDWDAASDWPNRGDSSFVKMDGERWHIQRRGNDATSHAAPKPKLLLLHGTAASTHSWAGLLPLLAEHFDVLATDLPGHGFTSISNDASVSLPGMADGIARLCARLDFAPNIAAGHSAGAAILARMCLDEKISPRLIISLNGALLPFPGMGGIVFPAMARLLFLNSFMPRVFAWQARDPKAVSRVITGTGSRLDQAGIEFYTRLFRSQRHVSAALAMMAQWDLDGLKRDLPRLTTPLVMIAAENDKAVAPDQAFKVRDIVPGSHVEYVRGLGHLAHEESPQAIARLFYKVAAGAGVLPQTAATG